MTTRGARPAARPHLLVISVVAGALAIAMPVRGAPDNGADPARARVAAQCAAFWEGAGAPDRAAAFRQLAAEAGFDRVEVDRLVSGLRPEMARLFADRTASPRARDLWERHAALCGGGASVD